jgi:hypothetical protein
MQFVNAGSKSSGAACVCVQQFLLMVFCVREQKKELSDRWRRLLLTMRGSTRAGAQLLILPIL